MFDEVILSIRPLNEASMAKCQLRLDNLTKPLGSLHSFEHLARKLAGICGLVRPRRLSPRIIVLNGSRRTPGLLEVFAEHVSAGILALDIAADREWNKEYMAEMVERGIQTARLAASEGALAIGAGMVGELEPAVASIIRDWNRQGFSDPMAGLLAIGSPEVAGLTGVFLGAAAGGAAVVPDGLAASAAAWVATSLAPQMQDYLVGSLASSDPIHAAILDRLGIPGYLNLGMNVGEGVGAALGISLLQASLHVLNDMKTFGEAEVHVAEDGPGALVQNRNVRD